MFIADQSGRCIYLLNSPLQIFQVSLILNYRVFKRNKTKYKQSMKVQLLKTGVRLRQSGRVNRKVHCKMLCFLF